MDAAAELGRNSISKHQIQPEYGDKHRGTELPNPSRETEISGANGDREISIFPVQLNTSRIGNLTRLILTLAICVTIHTYVRHTGGQLMWIGVHSTFIDTVLRVNIFSLNLSVRYCMTNL